MTYFLYAGRPAQNINPTEEEVVPMNDSTKLSAAASLLDLR
jgi:hypothetical protein